MKSLILVSAFAVALCATAADTSDSYIYWMMADDATYAGGSFPEAKEGGYTAKIVASASSDWVYHADANYLTFFSSANGGLGSGLGQSVGIQVGSGADNVPYFAQLIAGSSYDSWTYFVEIYNGGNIVARSEGLSLSQQSIVNLSEITNVPGGKMLVPATFTPASVPEPNSALLMLLGCAALALRRRKQVVA